MILLLLLTLWRVGPAAGSHDGRLEGLNINEIFLTHDSSNGDPIALAPGASLDGRVVALDVWPEPEQCGHACRENPECGWFNYCAETGCLGAGNSTLGNQECQLLAHDCMLVPPVVGREGQADAEVAGFPVRGTPPPKMPGYVLRQSQGLNGSDFSCPASTVRGICAYAEVLDALSACLYALAEQCRSVVVYAKGTDSCSVQTPGGQVALLKTANMGPSNSFLSPTVYTLEKLDAPTGSYLLNGDPGISILLPETDNLQQQQQDAEQQQQQEAEQDVETLVIANPPAASNISLDDQLVAAPGPDSPAPAAEGSAAAAIAATDALAASMAYLGCIVAEQSVMAGDTVSLMNDVPTAEQCCQACRANPRCNVWSWCGSAQGCSYQDFSADVNLSAQQCRLLNQPLVEAATGAPPYLLASGPGSGGFTGGAPLMVVSSELPGFTRYVGRGLFGQPGFSCSFSIDPTLPECVVLEPLQQLGQLCLSDPRCTALIYRPTGALGLEVPFGVLRHEEGANLSEMVYSPATITYMRNGDAAAGGGGSSSGLSAGSIAGIATAAVAAVLCLAAGTVVLARQRRKAARAAAPGLGGKEGLALDGSGTAAEVQLYHKPLRYHESRQQVRDYPLLQPAASGASSKVPGLPGMPPAAKSDAGPLVQPPPLVPLVPTRPRSGSLHTSSSSASSSEAPVQSPVIRQAVTGRQTAVSPFVSLRQARMLAAGAGAAAGSDGGTTPLLPSYLSSRARSGAADPLSAQASGASLGGSGPLLPASSVPLSAGPQEQELAAVMNQLIQHRALEEEAAAMPARAQNGLLKQGSGRAEAAGGNGLPPPHWVGPAVLPPSLQSWLIPPEAVAYKQRSNGELAVLGEGASGRVLQATYRGEVVAAKEVQLGRGLEVQQAFLTEAARMCALRHSNLVTFYGVVLDGSRGTGAIVMELCEGRDLASVLRLKDSSGQRIFGWYRHGCRIALEVATALNYLHARSVVHMDVKSSNVLLSARGVAKLGDVGLARLQTNTYLSDLPQMVGTFAWVAPEVLMGGRNCTQAVDIYSFSVMLFELFTGERPVRGHQRQPLVPEECPQEAADLMVECGSLDPLARPTAQQLMQRLAVLAAANRRRRS